MTTTINAELGRFPAIGLVTVDVGTHQQPGDAICVDVEAEYGAVNLTVDTEGQRKDVVLTPRQARALATVLCHFATEAER